MFLVFNETKKNILVAILQECAQNLALNHVGVTIGALPNNLYCIPDDFIEDPRFICFHNALQDVNFYNGIEQRELTQNELDIL